jgi:hypothetical protein
MNENEVKEEVISEVPANSSGGDDQVIETIAGVIEFSKYMWDEFLKTKKTVDTIVEVVTDAYTKDQEEADYNGFSDKATGLFDEELITKLKAIHGEDFDHTKALYDDVKSHRSDEGFDEDSYINEVIQDAAKRLAPITINPVVEEIAETGEVSGEEEEPVAEEEVSVEEEPEEEEDWESVEPDKSFVKKFGRVQ